MRHLSFAVVGSALTIGLLACSEAAPTGPQRSPSAQPLFATGGQSGIQLRLGSFGDGTKAAWKSGEGLLDAKGSRSQALLLQKIATTSTFSAAYAQVKGLEGLPPASVVALAWEHRSDGHCGAGAPRWNLSITGATGNSYTVFLGCAAASHSVGTAANWTRDSYDAAAIAAQVLAQAGSDGVNGRVSGLYILFDEGIDVGPGFVFLDNIRVNAKTFTSSSD